MLLATLQSPIVMIASAINSRLQRKLDYVEEERRVLWERLDAARGSKKLHSPQPSVVGSPRPEGCSPYPAKTRCRARNGQTSNGDLAGQGGAGGPGGALAGTDQDASASRADLSAQQMVPSGAAQLSRLRRQAAVVPYSAKPRQRDQFAAAS